MGIEYLALLVPSQIHLHSFLKSSKPFEFSRQNRLIMQSFYARKFKTYLLMVDGFWLNKANIATQPLDNQSHRSNFGKHIESCFDLLGNTLQTRHKKCLQSQDKTALTCLKSETCSIINLFQEKSRNDQDWYTQSLARWNFSHLFNQRDFITFYL